MPNCLIGTAFGSINYDTGHGFHMDYEDPEYGIQSWKDMQRGFLDSFPDPFKIWNYRIPAVVKEDFECICTKGPIRKWILKGVEKRNLYFRFKYKDTSKVTEFLKSKEELLSLLTNQSN